MGIHRSVGAGLSRMLESDRPRRRKIAHNSLFLITF